MTVHIVNAGTFQSGVHVCMDEIADADGKWLCTLDTAHPEPFHVAQGSAGQIYAVWSRDESQ